MTKNLSILCIWLVLLTGCISESQEQTNLRIQISNFPESFSPIKSNEFDGIVFQFLTETDSSGALSSNLVDISEKISVNDTISLYGFRIRDESKWFDGTPVSREDVLLTLKLNLCNLSTTSSTGNLRLNVIREFIADSSDARMFVLKAFGNPEHTRKLAGDFLIMPEHTFDPKKILRAYTLEDLRDMKPENAPGDLTDFFENFNSLSPYDSIYFRGSGPFQIESYYTDQSITFIQAENVRLPLGFKLPEKINYLMITDPTSARFAIQNNEIDIITKVPASEFVQLESFNKEANTLNLYRQAGFKFVFFGFNTRLPKFSNKDTRIALSHLVDIQGIIDAVRLGYADLSIGPVHPVHKDLYNDKLQPYGFSLEKAKAELKQLGWEFDKNEWKNDAGETLEFKLTYNGANPDYQKIALIVQSQAAKIGVQVNLEPEEAGNLIKKLRSHQFEAVLYSFVGSPTAYDYSPLFHTSAAVPGKYNFTGFGNPQSDEAIEEAILSPNKKEMAAHLRDLQQILHSECPIVFLYFEQSLIATSRRFPRLNISYYRPGYDPVGVF